MRMRPPAATKAASMSMQTRIGAAWPPGVPATAFSIRSRWSALSIMTVTAASAAGSAASSA